MGKSTILNKVVKGLSSGGDFPSHLLKGVHLKVEPEDARLIRFDIIRSFDRPIINSEAVTKMGLTLATEMDWQIFLLQRKYLDYQVNIGNRIIATLQSGEPDAAEKAQALSQPKKDFQDIMDSLFAETGKTAAELVLARADADKPNMGLTSWKGRIVRKGDIVVAKNYLTQDELDMLNRLVSIFLDVAEIQVKRRTDLTLPFWRGNVDRLIQAQDLALLTGGGSVSNETMEDSVRQTYETFDARRKAADARAADEADLKALEESIQHRKKETRR